MLSLFAKHDQIYSLSSEYYHNAQLMIYSLCHNDPKFRARPRVELPIILLPIMLFELIINVFCIVFSKSFSSLPKIIAYFAMSVLATVIFLFYFSLRVTRRNLCYRPTNYFLLSILKAESDSLSCYLSKSIS